MEAVEEKQKHERKLISWPVTIWDPGTSKFFLGRSANLSKAGMFISFKVGMFTGFDNLAVEFFREGQVIEINMPRTPPLAKEKGQFARIRQAKIERIEREGGLCVGIDIRFISQEEFRNSKIEPRFSTVLT